MIERLSREELDEVDFEIADAETRRSAVHHRNIRSWPEFGLEGATPEYAEAMIQRVLLGEMATDMFLDNPAARTATLGIIRLRGDWHRDRWAQGSITAPGSRLRTEYEAHVFGRDEPGNRLQYAIDPGVVSIKGVAMVTRQRHLLATESFEQTFTHASGKRVMGRLAILVSKLSTFALDLEQLREHPEAAKEIHEILLADMFLRANRRRFQRLANVMGDFDFNDEHAEDIELEVLSADQERAAMADLGVLHEKMRQYNINANVVLDRIAAGDSLRIKRPETKAAVEQAITEQAGLVVPSTSTLYGRRVIRSLSP